MKKLYFFIFTSFCLGTYCAEVKELFSKLVIENNSPIAKLYVELVSKKIVKRFEIKEKQEIEIDKKFLQELAQEDGTAKLFMTNRATMKHFEFYFTAEALLLKKRVKIIFLTEKDSTPRCISS